MRAKMMLGLVAVAVLVTGACAKKKPEKEGAVVKGIPTKLTVKVLETGKGAKRQLRYKYTAGAKQAMIMDMRMAMSLNLGSRRVPEIRMPAIKFHMAMSVSKVHASGNMDMAFEVTQLEVVSRAGVRPSMLSQMRRQLKALEGFKGSMTMSPRGEPTNVKMVVPPGVPAQVRQTMENFQQQMHQIMPPLPTEAVGVGAKWTAKMPITSPAFKAGQEATFELMALHDASAEIKVSLRQWAPPQKMNPPNLPPTASAKLKKLESKGKGSFKAFFTKPVVHASMSMDMDMSMHIKAGAQDQEMEMTMKMAMDMKPK